MLRPEYEVKKLVNSFPEESVLGVQSFENDTLIKSDHPPVWGDLPLSSVFPPQLV